MKVVQTTEFEVLGPVSDDNHAAIVQQVAEHTGRDWIPGLPKGFYILLGEDNSARPVHPSDYSAEYETVDDNVLSRLEEDFNVSDLARQGDLHTEEVWQCWEQFETPAGREEPQWWDAESAEDARDRTMNGQIRTRRDVHVTGPWHYYDVSKS